MTKLFFTISFNPVFALTLIDDPSLSLNGIATYNHMGKDYYIVAHYSTLSCSSVNACEQQITPSRYRLKMVTSRWTSHSYSLVWQRELTSNNDQIQLTPEDAKILLAFIQLPETQLTSGDVIDVYFDGKSTKILINEAQALTTPGKHLFNYIARVWIGPVPPSRQFKAEMLKGHQTQHNVKLVYEFEATIPLADRLNLLTQWQQHKAYTQGLKNSDINNIKIQRSHTATSSEAQKPSEVLKLQASRLEPSLLEASRLEASQSTKDKIVIALNAPQAMAEAPKNNLIKNTTQKTNTQKEKKEDPTLTQEQQYALLEWQINTEIFNQVNYPSWAKKLNKTGKISVLFSLDPFLQEANIISVSPTQKGLLADAVIEAIHKTFPANSKLQPLTQGKTVTLTYHHIFTLSRETEKPLTPAVLLENNLINSKIISTYLTKDSAKPTTNSDDLRNYLSQKVKYPYWAKSFNFEGTVRAKITLTPQGFVDDVKILTSSPHAGFNQAIIAAVKTAEPFPVAPNRKMLTFEYLHTFKP